MSNRKREKGQASVSGTVELTKRPTALCLCYHPTEGLPLIGMKLPMEIDGKSVCINYLRALSEKESLKGMDFRKQRLCEKLHYKLW